eukprot:scaffold16625_cov49-Phaeocystis_antarctica.AAC.2
MSCMVVTLEVLKLSGWLNALAYCRESNGGHPVREEVQSTGRREVASDRGASSVQGRVRLQIGSRARGGAHPEHVLHVLDAGGVEAQRLVECPRVVEHLVHVRDAGGVPAGNVRVEILQAWTVTIVILLEEPAHVVDGRDVPIGDGAVRSNNRIRVFGEGQDRRLQGSLARE